MHAWGAQQNDNHRAKVNSRCKPFDWIGRSKCMHACLPRVTVAARNTSKPPTCRPLYTVLHCHHLVSPTQCRVTSTSTTHSACTRSGQQRLGQQRSGQPPARLKQPGLQTLNRLYYTCVRVFVVRARMRACCYAVADDVACS